jgi:nitrate/nitrite transporter NarK
MVVVIALLVLAIPMLLIAMAVRWSSLGRRFTANSG